MTRGDLITAVARKLSFFITDPNSDELKQLQDLCNAGVVEVLLETHCYTDVGDMDLQVGVDIYRTDASILAVKNERIKSQSMNYSFDVVSMQEILDLQNGLAATAAPPGKVAFENDLMMLYPAPSFVDTIRFIYVPVPTSMTLDTHDPSNPTYGGIPSWGHRAIEYYMLWQAAETDDKTSALSPKDYKAIFEEECGKIRKRARAKARRSLTPARVGYPGSRSAGRRNDTYPER
jgi:hypothetical protein